MEQDKTKHVEFEWLIHYKCNYRCSYCFFDGKWEDVERFNKYLSPEKWIKAWMRVSRGYEYVRLLITGGEPFIYPSFIELLKELSKYFSIGFDTNLSCNKEQLIDFVNNTVISNISLGLSFHPAFSNFETFLEKALFLKENGVNNICVQYVAHPLQLEQMGYFQNRFMENGLYFIPLPFRGKYNGKDYPNAFRDEEKKMLYTSTSNLNEEHKERVKNHLNQVVSKNKLCTAGLLYARVDNDGTVYRCGHYATNSRNGTIGNLFNENFRLLKEPFPCEQEVCPCEFRWLVEN